MMYHLNRIMTIVVSASILTLGLYGIFTSQPFIGFMALGLGAIFTSLNVALLRHDIRMKKEFDEAQLWLEEQLALMDEDEEEERS